MAKVTLSFVDVRPTAYKKEPQEQILSVTEVHPETYLVAILQRHRRHLHALQHACSQAAVGKLIVYDQDPLPRMG
jgi:hypothetical protein